MIRIWTEQHWRDYRRGREMGMTPEHAIRHAWEKWAERREKAKGER